MHIFFFQEEGCRPKLGTQSHSLEFQKWKLRGKVFVTISEEVKVVMYKLI